MIMNIQTFDNLLSKKVKSDSLYDNEIMQLTKLPAQKSIIYNKSLKEYKRLAPTPKVNHTMALRSSQGSEILGDGSQHFKTQIRIAQAIIAPTEYQTEASKNDVSNIVYQQKIDLSAKRLFLDNLKVSQKAISALDQQHRVSFGAFMPNKGIVSPNVRKRPITAKHYEARVAY